MVPRFLGSSGSEEHAIEVLLPREREKVAEGRMRVSVDLLSTRVVRVTPSESEGPGARVVARVTESQA
jgi:hypothetical protein